MTRARRLAAMSRRERRRERTRRNRRVRQFSASVGVMIGVTLFAAGSAFGYWMFTTNSTAPVAVAGSVGQGQSPAASSFSVSGRDVTFSWTGATNATGYSISRTNVAPGDLSTTVGGTCTGTIHGLSCTDDGLPENGAFPTTWTYSDTPFFDQWPGATSAPSINIEIPAPSLVLETTSFSTAGGSTSATVSNFFDNEGVTYCLETPAAPCAAAQIGTGTVPASSGTTSDSIAIPAGLSVGLHIIYAVGSFGSVAAEPITVSAGAATQLSFTVQPETGQQIEATGTGSFDVAVAIEDAYGNAVLTDDTDSVTLSIDANPSSGALSCSNPGDLTVTASSGVAMFTGCTITNAGTGYTLTASSSTNPSLAAPMNADKLSIVAGTATTIAIAAGNDQSAEANTTFGSPLVVLVTDANGNPVSDASVIFTAPSSGPSGTFADSSNTDTVMTGTNGQASDAFTANGTAGGPYEVAVTSSGTAPNPLDFSESNE